MARIYSTGICPIETNRENNLEKEAGRKGERKMQSPSSERVFVFIDGSYFCFHRYYSLMTWWKHAHKTESAADLHTHPVFVEKFQKTFRETFQSIPKKLGLPKHSQPTLVVGKDCKRRDIWRMEHYPAYKASRVKEDTFEGGPLFQQAYQHGWFQGAAGILQHPRLEADDCIALAVQRQLEITPRVKIYIITSDKDYLQLVEPRVQVYDLSFKNLAAQKSSHGHAEMDLFCKIVMGDPSDNIPAIFPSCGPKTALKYYHDRAALDARLVKEPEAAEKFRLNTLLVDFRSIPAHFKAEFYARLQPYHAIHGNIGCSDPSYNAQDEPNDSASSPISANPPNDC